MLRDAGDWERFAELWHDDGRMEATWFQGSATDFITASRAAFAQGALVHHFLGGTIVDIAGDRAIAQTKMTISVRMPVHNIVCDILCTGRFYDFLEHRTSRWGLVLRRPIYEKDRMDAVDPKQTVSLDRERLASYPEGYRYLAYAQSAAGMTVAQGLPGLRGEAVDELYLRGARFLRGGPL